MKKAITAKEAAAMVKDGMTIMVGGFLAAGSPNRVIEVCSLPDALTSSSPSLP